MVKITKRAPGLSVKAFTEALSDRENVCNEARFALQGQTLQQFWETSTIGPWMAYWLGQFTPVIPFLDDFVLRYNRDGDLAKERRYAKAIRAAYHWDGTRKQTKP